MNVMFKSPSGIFGHACAHEKLIYIYTDF